MYAQCICIYFSHVRVLDSLNSEYILLRWTYKEHINAGHCPFVPGKVLDEFYRLLRLVRISHNLPPPFDVLQEVGDLCTV